MNEPISTVVHGKNRGRNVSQHQVLRSELQTHPASIELVQKVYDIEEEALAQKMVLRRRCMNNGGRPRENLTDIDPSLCTDEAGNYIKFVPERLSPQELAAFEELIVLCSKDPVTDWLSDNQKMRFLRGWNWNPQQAFEGLLNCERLRAENDCDTISYDDI